MNFAAQKIKSTAHFTSSRFCIFSSTYISRVFIKTEMVLKSKSVLSGSKQLVRSRSSDNLPTSQSQVNIQMMSHTLTIREVMNPFCFLKQLDNNWFRVGKFHWFRISFLLQIVSK
jgi:hypothetical protein